MSRGRCPLGFFCFLLAGLGPAFSAPKVGDVVQDFALADANGKEWRLTGVANAKVVVVAFLGVECPLAKLYAPRLQELATAYRDKGVAFVGVDSNRQDLLTELDQFAKHHAIEFPLLLDVGNAVADQLGAERTPEVFVFDSNRRLRYHGRIDDQYGIRVGEEGKRVNYQLPEPRRHDLATALDDILAGKEVTAARTEIVGCKIGRIKKADSDAEVTYSNQIARLFNEHCVYCHRPGQIGPFALTSYDEAVGWADMILEVVQQKRMPPWHADPKHGKFVNDARLSDEERDLIEQWVAAGAPQGDPSKAPAPAKFADGWMIPEPDQIIYMSDEPFMVQAEGTVKYQHFIVDPGWKEDKWITAMEPKPGNPAVVHHIVMFVSPPKGKAKYFTKGLPLDQLDWFASFAPGLRPPILPEDMGRFIPAGSKLVFQMHYTPNGKAQKDRSYIGVKFADPKKIKREIAVQHAGQMFFRIPAHAKDYRLEADYEFKVDSLLMTVSPHMHLRGKSFRYTLIYPDGKEEVILNVPQYDFGWQTTYTLAEPKRVPKGSKMHCEAVFDNSADNLNNPDPSKTVIFGEQTWDEMMYGWFEICLDQEIAPDGTASLE